MRPGHRVTDGRDGHNRRHYGGAIRRPRRDRRPRLAREATQLYGRELKRLKVWIRVLTALLAASIARVIVDGLSVSGGFAVAIAAVLLTASVALWRQGSRLTPGRGASRPTPPREPPGRGRGAGTRTPDSR
jgi:hypothetical protein